MYYQILDKQPPIKEFIKQIRNFLFNQGFHTIQLQFDGNAAKLQYNLRTIRPQNFKHFIAFFEESKFINLIPYVRK